MKKLNTETVIADMVEAFCGPAGGSREKHLYREALRSLVRLAKSEQMCELKSNVERLTSGANARLARRLAREILVAQRFGGPGQKQFEFNPR